jgi:hypothetical protein
MEIFGGGDERDGRTEVEQPFPAEAGLGGGRFNVSVQFESG